MVQVACFSPSSNLLTRLSLGYVHIRIDDDGDGLVFQDRMVSFLSEYNFTSHEIHLLWEVLDPSETGVVEYAHFAEAITGSPEASPSTALSPSGRYKGVHQLESHLSNAVVVVEGYRQAPLLSA